MPNHWRKAVVSPVEKRDRVLSLLPSWRPVSITAFLCRLVERIVFHRIVHIFAKRQESIGSSQFGFRRGVGTSLPLSGLSMFIADGFDQKHFTALWDPGNPDH